MEGRCHVATLKDVLGFYSGGEWSSGWFPPIFGKYYVVNQIYIYKIIIIYFLKKFIHLKMVNKLKFPFSINFCTYIKLKDK